jgi:hypothetical protein
MPAIEYMLKNEGNKNRIGHISPPGRNCRIQNRMEETLRKNG